MTYVLGIAHRLQVDISWNKSWNLKLTLLCKNSFLIFSIKYNSIIWTTLSAFVGSVPHQMWWSEEHKWFVLCVETQSKEATFSPQSISIHKWEEQRNISKKNSREVSLKNIESPSNTTLKVNVLIYVRKLGVIHFRISEVFV